MFFAYQTATVVTNCLFLVNFAVNFILYCVVNVQFRRTARDVLCCACSSALGRPKGMAYRGEDEMAYRGDEKMAYRGQTGSAKDKLTNFGR